MVKPWLEAQWVLAYQKIPILLSGIKGARVRDMVAVTWHDNLGATATQEIAVTQA